MQVSASSFGQLITLKVENMPLTNVLREIRKQSGYDLIFPRIKISDDTRISLNVRNATVANTLKTAFSGLPYSFEIAENRVSIKRLEDPSLFEKLINKLYSSSVSAKVVDENNQPISGATVKLKRTGHSIMTDGQGWFTFNGVNDDDVIVISYIGYDTKELVSGGILGLVKMTVATSKLDELQVIAYGTQSRRLGLGAVSTITSEDIEKQPVTNVLASLEGLVPGLNITPSSGAPGAAIKVQIRGQNSLNQQSYGAKPYDQPLFIVDGVPVAAQNANVNALTSLGGSNGNIGDIGGSSPINGINPSDIESISILKDISATSIYGTQGANGVILITTKKGKSGKAKVRANLNTALNSSTRSFNLLNTEQYLTYRREALKNDGINLTT
ncbi:MAG: SusC/RagA family TonB-linked outer membrane protein, partial [Pedobacter sp.]